MAGACPVFHCLRNCAVSIQPAKIYTHYLTSWLSTHDNVYISSYARWWEHSSTPNLERCYSL